MSVCVSVRVHVKLLALFLLFVFALLIIIISLLYIVWTRNTTTKLEIKRFQKNKTEREKFLDNN